jgi:hypothetical protein
LDYGSEKFLSDNESLVIGILSRGVEHGIGAGAGAG